MISKDDVASEAACSVARAVRFRLEEKLDEMTGLLGELVGIESGSDDADGLRAMADHLAGRFAEFGDVVRHPAALRGVDHLLVSVAGRQRDLPHAVVLGHFDTVWARGTLARSPFAVADDGRITGPGCFDMKGGLVLLYFALRELGALGVRPRRPLRIVLNADEEIGSPDSRSVIASAASGAGAAFVLEGPLPDGALKTARKGSASYVVTIRGRAAHAGIEPDKGVNAVVEMAHQLLALHALNDPARETTVNVGIARGGDRVNVVPPRAEIHLNTRTATAAEARRVRGAVESLRPVSAGASIEVSPGTVRPPMERTPDSARMFARAAALAAQVGIVHLGQGGTGGASDGNLVAAAGVPTLDGLGPEGGGAHADDEHVLAASLPRRAALLAGLLYGA